jgi:hypothetical protein
MAPEVAAFVAVAFLTVVVQYILLEEVPFWLGQRQWKRRALREATAAFCAAEQALRDWLGAYGAGGESSRGDAPFHCLAEFALGQERLRTAKEIPLHTINNLGDVAARGAGSLLLALLTALSGGKGLHPPT